MEITAIEEVSKSRSRIWIDGEPAFVLYKGELRVFRLQVGEEISGQDYRTIMGEVLPKRARLRAMNLLTKREYTESRLYDKLKEGGYPEEIIRNALDYVASFHYTDDLRYAVAYITDHENTRSRRRIEQDLLGKGIGKQTLEQAWRKWEEQGGSQDEQGMIRSLLQKRNYDPESADFREKQRTYAFLMRKGFSSDAVRKAMRTDEFDSREQ